MTITPYLTARGKAIHVGRPHRRHRERGTAACLLSYSRRRPSTLPLHRSRLRLGLLPLLPCHRTGRISERYARRQQCCWRHLLEEYRRSPPSPLLSAITNGTTGPTRNNDSRLAARRSGCTPGSYALDARSAGVIAASQVVPRSAWYSSRRCAGKWRWLPFTRNLGTDFCTGKTAPVEALDWTHPLSAVFSFRTGLYWTHAAQVGTRHG